LSYFGPAPNVVNKIATITTAAMQATTSIIFFIEWYLLIKSTSYALFGGINPMKKEVGILSFFLLSKPHLNKQKTPPLLRKWGKCELPSHTTSCCLENG
jgi:hypothetical protein